MQISCTKQPAEQQWGVKATRHNIGHIPRRFLEHRTTMISRWTRHTYCRGSGLIKPSDNQLHISIGRRGYTSTSPALSPPRHRFSKCLSNVSECPPLKSPYVTYIWIGTSDFKCNSRKSWNFLQHIFHRSIRDANCCCSPFLKQEIDENLLFQVTSYILLA